MKKLTYRFVFRPLVLTWLMALGALITLASPAHSANAQAVPLSGSGRAVIEQFLLTQTAGLSGKVVISIYTPLSGPLPPCEVLEPFLPGGARLLGRVSVGVRCKSEMPWTRYVPAYIGVLSPYYVAARPISAGQALTLADTSMLQGDLAALPANVIVDPAQLVGVIASNGIALGAPLRRDLLRSVAVVQQGQTIKMVTQGPGFVISAEGKAMASAAAGQIVQVKIQGGQLLSGVVRADGTVERTN